MPTLLLIHGAWCSGRAWDCLLPELDQLGASYQVIDLPGHGENRSDRSMWSVSLADYADAVINAASTIDGQVVAVGHSMGGMVISTAAAKAPSRFHALIYLAAFLPKDGERLIFLAGKDKDSQLSQFIKPRLLGGASRLSEDCLDDVLFNGCSLDNAAQGKSMLQDNPIRPPFSRVRLSPSFEALPKHYIRCLDDRAITPTHQAWMAGRYEMVSVQEIESDHMAPYSAARQTAQALVGALQSTMR